MRATTTQPDLQIVLRGGIAVAVWIALVLLLVGSIWELRSGAAGRQSPAEKVNVK